MGIKFEIARIIEESGEGRSVVVLSAGAAAQLDTSLESIKVSGVSLTNADRGLRKKLHGSGSVILDLDDAKANRLVDLLEFGLGKGVVLDRAVYALGEKLAHRLDQGCYFGPRSEEVVSEEAA